jgi:hypothetical protein
MGALESERGLLPKRGSAFREGHKKSSLLLSKSFWEEPEKQKSRSCRAQEFPRSRAQWKGRMGTKEGNESNADFWGSGSRVHTGRNSRSRSRHLLVDGGRGTRWHRRVGWPRRDGKQNGRAVYRGSHKVGEKLAKRKTGITLGKRRFDIARETGQLPGTDSIRDRREPPGALPPGALTTERLLFLQVIAGRNEQGHPIEDGPVRVWGSVICELFLLKVRTSPSCGPICTFALSLFPVSQRRCGLPLRQPYKDWLRQ